mmetsp:Transcript_147240/g.271665  ORF Transcript_147240/g.271665 Transcript_147240/m.271665 type:complete len:197 (-) Transcript_147240:78-668(-)
MLSCSIIFPFLSLCGFLVCRRRLAIFMHWFNKHYFHKIEKEFKDAKDSIAGGADAIAMRTRNTTTGLPSSVWGCCFKRKHMPSLFLDRNNNKGLRNQTMGLTEMNYVKSNYTKFKSQWVEKVHYWSRSCMVLGVASNVLCATFLLGMYFQSKYDDQSIFLVYCACMIVGCATTFFAWCWTQYHEPSEDVLDKSLLG